MVITLEFINKMYRILKKFNVHDEIQDIKTIVNGHINTTYLVKVNDIDYIIQGINTEVFKKPREIMENIKNVTAHIRSKLIIADMDPERGTLNFLCDREGKNYFVIENEFWRVCPFIVNTSSYNRVKNLKMLTNAGYGFGNFQKLLSDYPMRKLHETIPDFHNTKKRLDYFFECVEKDDSGRVKDILSDVQFFKDRYESAGRFTDMIANKTMPIRVTHNDTKYNNILIDNDTYEAVCVIDLDTVMPGLAVYDFGDAIRFAASTAAEDETNLEKVSLDMKYFEAFTKGFIGALESSLENVEIENMAQGCINITVELASRFLADHINGDKYFRIHHPNHNLERARSQMRLAAEMEKKFDEMNKIIYKYKH